MCSCDAECICAPCDAAYTIELACDYWLELGMLWVVVGSAVADVGWPRLHLCSAVAALRSASARSFSRRLISRSAFLCWTCSCWSSFCFRLASFVASLSAAFRFASLALASRCARRRSHPAAYEAEVNIFDLVKSSMGCWRFLCYAGMISGNARKVLMSSSWSSHRCASNSGSICRGSSLSSYPSCSVSGALT